MGTVEAKAREDLSALIGLREDLIELLQDLGRLAVDTSSFGFMASVFFFRQRSHLESLARLGNSRDSILVARTMFEGAQVLVWAGQDTRRAEDWLLFAAVERWRELRNMVERGEVVGAEIRDRIERDLAAHGARFIDDRSPDGYRTNWRRRRDTIRRICKETGDDSAMLYDLYSEMSDWQHWGVNSLSRTLDSVGDSAVSFQPCSIAEEFRANLLGFRSACRTADILFKHVANTSKATQLAGIVRRSYVWLSTLQDSEPDAGRQP